MFGKSLGPPERFPRSSPRPQTSACPTLEADPLRQVLFITDDPIRPELESPSALRADWEIMVCNGSSALASLSAAQFHAVVCDLRAGAGGLELLGHVREHYPGIVRVLLLEDFEHGSASAALAVAHRFLSKPCDLPLLSETIERCLSLTQLLAGPELEEIGVGGSSLPPAPAVFLELQREVEAPEPDVERVREILEREPAMVSQVLHRLNSAIYGRGRTLVSLDEALTTLGLDMIRNLVLDTALQEAFPSELAEGFQLHGKLCSRLAPELLDDPADREIARCAGLVHDVGKFVLASRHTSYEDLLELAAVAGRPLHDWERDVLGSTHAEVGAYVLGLWGLPWPVVEAVAHHHQPSRAAGSRFDATGAVHVANVLVQGLEGEEPIDMDYLVRVGAESRLPAWREVARDVGRASAGSPDR